MFIDQIDSQNKAKNAQYSQFMAYANNPNVFALGLKDACCKEPLCCCASALGSPLGFTACWARSKILDTYHNGTADFICCQNYLPPCCCLQPAECCPGSALGLCLEGCCFPMTSLSVARLHMMDTKQIQPDPCDWQIIAFANFLQILSCLFHIAAIFAEEFRDAAAILDLIADLVTLSVAGCMGAQVYHEVQRDVKNGYTKGQSPVAFAVPVAGGMPVAYPGGGMMAPQQGGYPPQGGYPGAYPGGGMPVAMARPVGAPIKSEEMER